MLGTLLVSMISTAAPAAPAPTPVGLTVGAKVGLALGGGGVGLSPGLALEVRKPLWLENRLGLVAELGGSLSSNSGTFSGGPVPQGQTWRVNLVAAPVMVGAFYAHPLSPSLSLFGQVGGVGAWLRASTQAGGGTSIEHGFGWGFDAAAGAEHALGPGRLVGELGYRWLRTRVGILGEGNPSGPLLRFGYRFSF